MHSSTVRSIAAGSFWGILAKMFDAAAKFFTIPMLIAYYGKADYGLIALALSLDAYLRLMDMGMNIGSIRFFSMWFAKGEFDRIANVSQSSIVFYGVIGLVNAVLFILIGNFSTFFFKLNADQINVF